MRKLITPRVTILVAATVLVSGLFGGFAYELIHSQGDSRRQAERSFGVEAAITSELTGSLFSSSVSSSTAQAAKAFGQAKVSVGSLTLFVRRSHLAYALIVDRDGRVLASSPGTPLPARRRAPKLVRKLAQTPARRSWLSDLSQFDGTHIVEWAVPFATTHGLRFEVAAIDARTFSGFLRGYLQAPDGSPQRVGYIVDGSGHVIADSSGHTQLGARLEGALAETRDGGRYSSSRGERYAASVPLAGSDWQVLLTEPTRMLYPALAGPRSWIVDGVLSAFGLLALLSLVLLRRMLRASDRIAVANRQLSELNATLEERVAERTAVAEQRADELARSNSELEQFASVASHDLQEPLRKIRMYCGRLPQRLGAVSEEGASDLARIQSAAMRMQQLIDDLLSFARISSRQRVFEPVDLNVVVGEVVGDLEGRIEAAGARVEVGELPVVTGDRVQMGQLLQNLLSNAIKFQRPDVPPEIQISAELVDAMPPRFDGHRVPGRRCLISVRDNGIGFDPKYAERIFSAFERLHGRSEYEGTGIGLSIARKIAWRHGGDLSAASAPGEGSTFTVMLPLSDTAGSLAERAA